MQYIWINNVLIPEEKAVISIKSHALHYGTGAFEGIRFYETENGPSIFKLSEHIKRLFYSSKVIGIDIPYSQDELEKAVKETVQKNGFTSGYIRPIVFYGKSELKLSKKNLPIDVAIIVLPWGKMLPPKGVSLKTVSIKRFNPGAFDLNAKLCGPYVNSITAHTEAENSNYDEALMLTEDDMVAEGAGENFFIVKNSILYTPPEGNILPGITRDSIFTIAAEKNIVVKKKDLTLQDCFDADEAFFTGTAAEVTPISSIDDTKIGNGDIGPITKILREEYMSIVKGTSVKHKGWLTYCSLD